MASERSKRDQRWLPLAQEGTVTRPDARSVETSGRSRPPSNCLRLEPTISPLDPLNHPEGNASASTFHPHWSESDTPEPPVPTTIPPHLANGERRCRFRRTDPASGEVCSFSHSVLFGEIQRFCENPIARSSVLILVGIAGVLFWVGGAATSVGRWIGLAFRVSVSALLLFGELRTEVRPETLLARLFPLTREHRFTLEEIERCEARTHRPILEHGGWGIRVGRGGKAYNVHGNRGVQLEP